MSKKIIFMLIIAGLVCTAIYAQGHFDQERQGFDLTGIDRAIRYAVDDLADNVGVGRSVAVFPVRARDFERSVRNHVQRRIEMNFDQLDIRVHDRDNIDLIIAERAFQSGMEASPAFSDQEMIAIGATAGVDFVVRATLDGGDGVPPTITLEMINVRTSRKHTAVRP